MYQCYLKDSAEYEQELSISIKIHYFNLQFIIVDMHMHTFDEVNESLIPKYNLKEA